MNKRQPQQWGAGEQAQQHYLVEPRALAGGGDIRHVSAFLRASGWRDKSKAGGPLRLVSPDRTALVLYDPSTLAGAWKVQGAIGRREEWWATLGQLAPVEIVAGFTDALTRPRAAHAFNVWAPLAEQRWRNDHRDEHLTVTSPDDSAWLQFHQSGDEAIWKAGATDNQGNSWAALFASNTPMHLVHAFATALASPEPVMRPRGHVPPSARVRTTSVSVLPSQLSAWQQARITAARAAIWGRSIPPGQQSPAAGYRPHR